LAGICGTSGYADGAVGTNKFNTPVGIIYDNVSGFLYVTDQTSQRIRKVNPTTGATTTLAGSGTASLVDATGTAATFNNPRGIVTDGTSLYVADYTNHAIRQINIASAIVTTLVGGNGAGYANGTTSDFAKFNGPMILDIDTTSNTLYVSELNNHAIRAINIPTGTVSTFAGPPISLINRTAAVGSADNSTGYLATMNQPIGMAEASGYLYFSDYGNNLIRKIALGTGAVSTVAGNATAGTADGIGGAARFNAPYGMTTDGNNLYIAEYTNNCIRKLVIATSAVTTLAGSCGAAGTETDNPNPTLVRFNGARGIVIDPTNTYLLVTTGSHNIRKVIISTGATTTLAGGGASGHVDNTGTAARFSTPSIIVTDGTNFFVGDSSNHAIRQITSAGVVTTLAGTATTVSGFIDATGTAARFNGPTYIATDGTNLYVSDSLNHAIRKVVIATGVVTTLLGSSTGNGDDDAAVPSILRNPLAVYSSKSGLFFTTSTYIRLYH
jgi:hypothetical protein